jgi:hypothetical protein
MNDENAKKNLVSLINHANKLGLQISGVAYQFNADVFMTFDSNGMMDNPLEHSESLSNICLLIKHNGNLNGFILDKAKIENGGDEKPSNVLFEHYPYRTKTTH